jgi:hypothetical protein
LIKYRSFFWQTNDYTPNEESNEFMGVKLSFATQNTKNVSINKFETFMSDLHLNHCNRCKRVGMDLKMSSGKINDICCDCKLHPYFDPVSANMVPVWFDEINSPVFTVPLELCDLREGEKLLIQMIAPYVPLVHIKNGTLGIKGHVCSFPQQVQDVCTSLPRLPETAVFVKMVRSFKAEDGNFGVKSFTIRRAKVLAALRWLVKYNPLYREEVTIEEKNLDWMGSNEEAELPCHESSNAKILDPVDINESYADMGPAKQQCMPDADSDCDLNNLPTCGLHVTDTTPTMCETDESICDAINNALKHDSTLQWPYVSPDAINEFNHEESLFCKAFPWLFPGGVGDFNDYRERNFSETEWAKRLLQYEDGRFAKDKMWSFFVLNFTTRRRNQTSGRFFVDGFHKNSPESVEELQERISGGDTSFINHLTYYSQKVRGGSGFWRSKRAELYSWINYHVKHGHGMPNFFITLSCAEYFWPDIIRLLNERLLLAGDTMAVSSFCTFEFIVVIDYLTKNNLSVQTREKLLVIHQNLFVF